MHASLALCVMMFGGVVYPDSEITTIPLQDDLSNLAGIQELEWREHVKRKPLPRVPTVDDRQQSSDDSRYRRSYPPTDPRAMQPRQQMMPEAPTSPGGAQGQMGYGPSANGQTGYGGQTGVGQPGANDPYANLPIAGRNPVAGYSNRGLTNLPQAPTVQQSLSYYPNSVNSVTNPYGLSNTSMPTANPSVGGSKPFSNYQAPTGFTPWQLLNQPTQGGTINPYTAYVQPTLNQQNVNSHLSEQINGVQTMQRNFGYGTPGVEMNTGGNGLVNPQIFQNYIYNPMGR